MANAVQVDRDGVAEEVTSELRLQSVTQKSWGHQVSYPTVSQDFSGPIPGRNKVLGVRSIFPRGDDFSIVEATSDPTQSSDPA